MYIRRYVRDDAAAVRRVHEAAFRSPGGAGPPVEARLAEELDSAGVAPPQLSLVAVIGDEIVGHVVCSRGRIVGDGSPDRPALGLGPIGVLPDHQRRGIGFALMHAVVGAADALDEPLVALVGEPSFYRHFGFEPSHRYGISPPDPAWGDYFQVRPLSAYEPELRGTFRYAEPFETL
jgi:putative acetyltransferase